MKLIRALFLTLAVLLPTSWTIAHAEGMGGASGETKKKSRRRRRRTRAAWAAWEERSEVAHAQSADLVGDLTGPRAPRLALMKATTPRHHWIVRATHWVNALALAIMIGSGLRIFNAYPAFARKGESFCCYPFEGDADPRLADVRRLAGRRAPLALRGDVGAGARTASSISASSTCTASGAIWSRGAASSAIRWRW